MVTRSRVLLCLASLLASVPANAQDASLSASVDRSTIRENESFTYVLRAEGRVAGEPDVSSIEQDFDVLNRSTSARIQTINGRTEQVAEYIYQLMPRAPGEFTLPSIELGGLLSNEVDLVVEPVVASEDAPADIFMEVEVDSASAYVQSQIVYTLRLFVGVGIGRATLTQPLVSGGEAIIERLGEDRQYQTVRGNRSFSVRERRYAIFPQAVGTIAIGPSTFEAMVIPNRGFSRVQRLRSDSVSVEVLAAVAPPASHPNAVWLPARRLELTETWADTASDFALGVPRTRVLSIVAEGLLETQLPELEVGQADGVRQYPDQPELERQITDAGLVATRTQRYAVIAQAPGEATIPPAELPWWNVAERRWEVARVDGSVVPVLPGAEEVVPLDAPQPATAEAAPAADAGPWPWIAALLGAGWLLTALGWWRAHGAVARARDVARRPGEPAPAPLPSRRSVLRQLRAACAVDDPERARHLLLVWGRLVYPDAPPGSLGALAEQAGGELAAEVENLEAHLYGRAAGAWQGGRLAELVAHAGGGAGRKAAADDDPLEPLYR